MLLLVALTGCTNLSVDPPQEDASGGAERALFTKGVSTLAGWSEAGIVEGSREVNLFHNPVNVAYGPDGALYTADFDNNRLRVTDMTGMTSTVIFTTGFARPFGLAFANGTLFVETDDDPKGAHSSTTGTLWRIDLTAKTAMVVLEDIGRPRGLTALADGRLAMSDYVHHVVRIADPATGNIEPLAGSWDIKGYADGVGEAARFASPYGVVQRPDGSLLVADLENNRLRVVTLDGNVTTLSGGEAGFADGSLATARFAGPQGLAVDAAGDVFVTDLGNARVRRVRGDSIDTVAGNGAMGYRDDDDPLASSLYGLEGVSVSPDGKVVFVADGTRGEDVPFNRVRLVRTTP